MLRVLSVIACSTAVMLSASCVRRTSSNAAPSYAYQPTDTMPCAKARSVVIDNHSANAIHVTTNDGSPNAFGGDNLGTVLSGRIDTLKFLSRDRRNLDYRDDRPALPSGSFQRISDVRLWCIG